MFEVKYVESPSVVWKTALPRLNKSCMSPEFTLNGNSKVHFKITGGVTNSMSRFYESWTFELVNKGSALVTGVIFYIEKKNGERVRRFRVEMGNGCEFKLTSSQLSDLGITDDILFMIFVFDCHVKFKTDILKELETPQNKDKNSKQAQADRPPIQTLCLRDFSNNIQTLFNNSEYSDTVLKCGDQNFHVHRNILSSRSEVFAAMFRNKMSENHTGIVEIKDLDSSLMEKFLQFVYSGQFDALSLDLAFDLYKCGDKYAVSSLKQKCASFMVDNLSEDNVCQVLLLAHTFGDTELLDVAMNFAVSRVKFLGSSTWNDFAKDHPEVAVKVYQKFHTK